MTQYAGNKARFVGLNFEKQVFNQLYSNSNLTKNIISYYQDINTKDIKLINVLKVNQINKTNLRYLKRTYQNYNHNFTFDLPKDHKRAADLIILYVFKDNLYNIGIDTKTSKSSMTQLVKKSYHLLKQYINKDEDEYLHLYLQYNNKKRIWRALNKDNEFKKHISNMIEHIKTIWIQERFDINPLYHNHLILTQNNDIYEIIILNKLLDFLTNEYSIIKRTNIVFQGYHDNINYPLVCVKPCSSKKWDNLQLSIYKKAFKFDNISFTINL